MNIAIITWNNFYNFGTFLQAYALQKYLSNIGVNAVIIDDYHFSVRKTLIDNIIHYVKFILKFLFFRKKYENQRKEDKSVKKYQYFKKQYLNIDADALPLEKLNYRYDLFVCGSDQIWNPGVFNKYEAHKFYFATFATKPKVAYAPSVGRSGIPKEIEHLYKEMISNFSMLSTRELGVSNVLEKISGKQTDTVLDPTLLLERDEWYKLLRQSDDSSNTLLFYLLTYNIAYYNKAVVYAKQNGLNLVVIKPCGVNMPVDETVSAGPIEFLHLISTSKFIMTDYFHAVIFSIIYKKQFAALKRFKKNNKENQNIRLDNLLNIVNLADRFIDEESLGSIETLPMLDYSQIDSSLSDYINHSKEFLNKAIKLVENE